MNIGRAVYFFEKNDVEKERIRQSVLEKEGRPFEVFDKYAVLQEDTKENPFWKRTIKFLKIKGGFRPGRGNANQHIISVILNGLKTRNEKCEISFWKLYQLCVISMLNIDFIELNDLMLKRNVDGNPESAKDIIQTIKNYSQLHDVENEHIRWLYEVYWFPRIENIDEILNTKSELTIELVTEIIKEAQSKQKEINKSFTCILEKIEGSLSEINKKVNDSADKKELSDLKKKNDELYKELEVKIASVDSKIETRFASMFEGRISDLEKRLTEDNLNQKENSVTVDEKDFENYKKTILGQIASLEKRVEESLASKKEVKTEESIPKDQVNGFVVNVGNEKANKFLGDILDKIDNFVVGKLGTLKDSIINLNEFNHSDFVGEASIITLDDVILKIREDSKIVIMKNISDCFVLGTIKPYIIHNYGCVGSSHKKLFIHDDGKLIPRILSEILTYSLRLDFEVICEYFESFESEPGEIDSLENIKVDLFKLISNQEIYIPEEVKSIFDQVEAVSKVYLNGIGPISISTHMVLYPYIHTKYGNSKLSVLQEVLKGYGI